MKRRTGNPQAMTYDQVEQRKDRGAEGLRRLGEEERADNLDEESVEDFAERKNITILNPRRKTVHRGGAEARRRKNLFGFGGGRKVVSREEAQELQQDAARSHCNKGEYKQAQKTARMSPRRFARQRGMQLEGVVSRTKKKVKRKLASKLLPLLENPRRSRRKNASNGEVDQAKEMFSKFHGRRPESIEEIQTRQTDRRTLTGLGLLYWLRTDLTQQWQGKGVGIYFSERDKVITACDPQGNQIYFLGGNQDITSIIPRDVDRAKDFIDLGECSHIIYTADKDFDNFEEKDYQHEFGEETGERPKLMFDCLNKQLYLIGGAYQVKREGIVN